MKEFLLNGPQSLTETLDLLNKIFVVVDNKTDKNKKSFLKQFKELVKNKSEKKAWDYVREQAVPFNHPNLTIVDPTVLFQNCKLSPYIGEKDHGVMFCKGMVIGLKLKLDDNANISYRLDFDLDKWLHINFEIFDGENRYPFCIPLNFSTGRYGFSQKDKESCENDGDKKIALLQLTKVKFWLKMTIGYTLSTMNQQPRNAPQQHDDQIMEKQLFSFLQGRGDYSFDSIKEHIVNMLPGAKGKHEIIMCENEQALLECINKKPAIRTKVRNSIFVHISENDDSGRLLSGLHHNYDVEPFIDSETRDDSEQPPKPK